jgi:hypothetical protein
MQAQDGKDVLYVCETERQPVDTIRRIMRTERLGLMFIATGTVEVEGSHAKGFHCSLELGQSPSCRRDLGFDGPQNPHEGAALVGHLQQIFEKALASRGLRQDIHSSNVPSLDIETVSFTTADPIEELI